MFSFSYLDADADADRFKIILVIHDCTKIRFFFSHLLCVVVFARTKATKNVMIKKDQ